MTDRPPDEPTVTQLLQAVRRGEQGSLDRLMPRVYRELRALAGRQRSRWDGDLTLNATALVHEAYLKLIGRDERRFPENRGHFFAVAAKAMRHILCDHARDRRRQKRGAGSAHLPIDAARNALPLDIPDAQAEQLAALDEALRRLEEIDRRQARVVECRFFGGLSIEDTAEALGVSPATVKRDWAIARAWLYREIQNREIQKL